MKTRLIDFRPSAGNFSEPFGVLLQTMAHDLMVSYIGKIGAKFELEETNSLTIGIWNSDVDTKHLKASYLGTKKGGRIGIATCYLSETLMQKLCAREKRLYILGGLHQMMLNLAKTFGEDDAILQEAYQKMKESDFYLKASERKSSRDKKYTAWIELLDNFGRYDYRLAILNNSDNVKNTYYIAAKESWVTRVKLPDSTSDLNFFEKAAKAIYVHNIQGWEKDKFYFSWSEEEKYEFNADTKELRRITT